MKTNTRLLSATFSAILFLLFFGKMTFAQTAPVNDSVKWFTYVGGSSSDYQTLVAVDTAHNCFYTVAVTCSFDGDCSDNHSIDTASWYEDFVVTKYNTTTGAKIWSHCYGGLKNEYPHAIIVNADGDVIVTGEAESMDQYVLLNHGAVDAWIVKIDSSGNLIWEKSYGGPGNDDALSIVQTPDGGYIIAGMAGGYGGDITTYGGGWCDGWFFKLDPSGNLVWQYAFGGSAYDLFYGIAQMADGSFVLTGYSNSLDGTMSGIVSHGSIDGTAVKIDSTGATLWVKSYGGSFVDMLRVSAPCGTGTIIVGRTKSNDDQLSHNYGDDDGWVLVIDNSGVVIYSQSFGGSHSDDAYAVVKTAHQFVIAILTNSNDSDFIGNHGGFDVCLIKLDDSLFTTISYGMYGGNNDEYGFMVSLCLTKPINGDFLIGTSSNSTDSTSCTHGNHLGTNTDIEVICLKNLDTIYIAPDTSTNDTTIEDTTVNDTTSVIHIPDVPHTVSVYPNPTTDYFVVNDDGDQPLGEIILYNTSGSIVFKQKTRESELNIDTSNLPAGIYYCSVGRQSKRIVVVR